ncbi:MAG: DUF4384 domain-containing protein [Gemmatimonadetes bacterium]|nr:DUF4384 domain-containing protein [Gemmatimonadota bacterium]NNM05050.1 DUF4384 domain-containing protein [Gemmatimonadota bacterium]
MRFRQMAVLFSTLALVWSGPSPNVAAGQNYDAEGYQEYPLEARVWLDRGAEPVLQRGERARIYYRVSESAFVSIFHIDTNGTARMIFPSSPQENHHARGGRDYRVLFPGSTYWYVNDDPGVGYFFIVASPEPFDFRDLGYSHYAGGWDLSRVGRQVYGDPYLAMDDYVASLVPDWEYVAYGLDFTSYHVERHHEYPRFLCYDCHGFQPYYSWNPYAYSCSSFRVVIYSDPYYYPSTRYRGTRVVYVQPRRGVPRFGFKERAIGDPGTPNVIVRNTPPVTQPGVEGTQNRRAVPRTGAPSAFTPGSRSGNSSGVTNQRRPGVEAGSSRRTGSTGSQPGTSRSTVTRGGTSTGSRPTARSGGSSTRSSPTVTRGGTSTGSRPTARSGGSSTRSSPTVRSRGTPSRSAPTARSGGSSARSSAKPRSGGSSGAAARPRTSKPPPRPKVKVRRPGGGGMI